ncbi:hypothetical protein EV122DRAFT_285333 [Schizophyllum commune]
MAKGDRQNKKNWAEGVREEIMSAHLPKYTEELAKGGKAAAEYAVKVCHELNYKVPYYLSDDEEPDTVPEYDHENPPPLPKLSDEEEKKRAAALLIRNKRVVNWLNYRARKVVPAIPKGSRDFNNAFALWMMRLTGTSGAPKKARQGWQQYQHENHEFVQESAQRAWDAKRAKKAGGSGRGRGQGANGPESEIAEGAVSDGKKKQKGVGFTSEHARTLFNGLPADERSALKERAQAEKEAEKALWDKAINAPPSQEPRDVQAARNALPSFLNPILDGINQNAGDAHVLVLIGGREPKKGGIATVQHYDVGTNKQDLHFSEWDNKRFNRDVLGLFGEYLQTVWNDDECAKMALEGPLEEEDPEEDFMGNAPYRFGNDINDGDVGGGGGKEAGDGGEWEWDDGEEAGGGYGEEDGGGEQGGDKEDEEGDAGGTEDCDTEDVEDDVEQPPSKRQRFGEEASPDGGRGLPAAMPIASEADEPRAQLPSSKPPRPRPRPTRVSTRKGGAAAQSASQPPSTTTSMGINLVAGIPIDPELLGPSYTQSVQPAVEDGTPSTASSPHAATIEPTPAHAHSPHTTSAPLPLRTPTTTTLRAPPPPRALPAVTPPTHISTDPTHHPVSSRTAAATAPCEDDLVAAFPDVPDEAAAWFVSAMEVLRVELGGEWVRLLQAWTKYEDRRNYGKDLPARGSRLDGAKTRPREVSAWIAGGRWRSPGCEPVRKAGKFAAALMSAWWAWYVMLVPDWREEDERGRLDDFDGFGGGMGKLDVPGVNGVLSLIVCLKWVGEALVSDVDVHDRADVNRDWRRAITDLAKMLEAFEVSR